MADAPKDENIDEAKMDGLLKKMLSTPPTPHKKPLTEAQKRNAKSPATNVPSPGKPLAS